MSSPIPILRAKIIERLGTVAALTEARVHAGRPSGRFKSGVLAKGPRAWAYFRREEFVVLSKGTANRALKCTAEFGVEIWAIPPAVEPDEETDPAALEDLMDEISLAAKKAIETDVTLQGVALLCTVKAREVDVVGDGDTDLGAAMMMIEVVYRSVEGA